MIPTGGCALANLIAGEDPIGTATPFDQLFLIQIPPPWDRIALDSAAVPEGVRQALVPAAQAKKRAYILLIDGDPHNGAAPLGHDDMRVLFYRKPGGPAGAYVASEFLVARDATVELIRTLSERDLAAEPGAPQRDAPEDLALDPRFAAGGSAGGGIPEDVETVGIPALRRLADPVRDLFFCTHGERDGCCGTFGEAAYRYALETDRTPGARVWRISHFGGHRFAPTLVDMPTGRVWGKLNEAAMDAILAHAGPVADLRPMYRGWCALHPAGQFVERELFLEHGWVWDGARVDVMVEPTVEPAGSAYRVRLDARTPHGEAVRAEASIVEREPVVLPLSCGADESAVPQYAYAAEPAVLSAVEGDRTGRTGRAG